MEKDHRQIACPVTSGIEGFEEIVEGWCVLDPEHVAPTVQSCEKRLSKKCGLGQRQPIVGDLTACSHGERISKDRPKPPSLVRTNLAIELGIWHAQLYGTAVIVVARSVMTPAAAERK